MKKSFLKLYLPMLLVLLAVTTAFTTSKSSMALVYGYVSDPENGCYQTSTLCSTISNGTFCRLGYIATNPRLWGLNQNDECVLPLYKPQ